MKASKTFEDNMQRLEQIVRALEKGDVPLEDSLKLFQEGTELAGSCAKLLEDAQLKIKQLSLQADGSLTEEEVKIEL